jgi:hypothetical protein
MASTKRMMRIAQEKINIEGNFPDSAWDFMLDFKNEVQAMTEERCSEAIYNTIVKNSFNK